MKATHSLMKIRSVCFSYILAGICTLAFIGFYSQASFAAQKNLEQVQQELEGTKQQTTAKMNSLDAAREQERQALRAEHQKIMAEVAQRKAKAQELQDAFTALQEQEKALEAELATKKAMTASIQATVNNNANLFLQSVPSYIAAQLDAERKSTLQTLADSKGFPSMKGIETLLNTIQESIAKSGEIQKIQEKIYTRDGKEVQAEILHLGAFQSYYSADNAFGFTLKTSLLDPLKMAPYVANVTEQEALRLAFADNYVFPLDFTSGQLLLTPPKDYSVLVTIQESGIFGWCIIFLGVIGALLCLERFVFLSRIKLHGESLAQGVLQASVSAPLLTKSPSGRVLLRMLLGEKYGQDTEILQKEHVLEKVDLPESHVLERRSEEGMLKELPTLERFLNTIRTFAAISPLLGLLGTVSGIVTTFRVITAYGNSDPKLLSGGISEALLTTEMGLLVAIPLLLAHHFLQRRMNNIVLDMELASTIIMRKYTKV